MARQHSKPDLEQGRVGVGRTTQMNFRCSPQFKEQAAAMANHLSCSIPDLFELALGELRRATAFDRPK
jgi:hypothetical protein